MVTFEKIEECFDGANISRFANKHKIFIYDCCRGFESPKGPPNNLQNIKNKNIHKDSNKISIYATTKNYKTPDTEHGSYLTQSIYRIFYGNNKDPNIKENKKQEGVNYAANFESILKLSVFQLWQLIKYETEKQSHGYECVHYVSTQNGTVYLQKCEQTENQQTKSNK